MSALKQVLEKFNSNKGIVGSLVCTRDGILIEADLSERFEKETLSALVSSVTLAVSNTCKNLEFENFSSYHIVANKGDMIISDLEKSIFVVMLEKGADKSAINVEIFQTATQLKKLVAIG